MNRYNTMDWIREVDIPNVLEEDGVEYLDVDDTRTIVIILGLVQHILNLCSERIQTHSADHL